MQKFKTGEIVKAICKEMNLTNKQVAEIISMTPQNVSRLFSASNLNTETIDRLTQGLGINIYAALAKKWEEYSEGEFEGVSDNPVEREYVRLESKIKAFPEEGTKPKISILIEINREQQDDVLKLLNLGKFAT
jgi:transcriptional regulator with XRE-family HTH domain